MTFIQNTGRVDISNILLQPLSSPAVALFLDPQFIDTWIHSLSVLVDSHSGTTSLILNSGSRPVKVAGPSVHMPIQRDH